MSDQDPVALGASSPSASPGWAPPSAPDAPTGSGQPGWAPPGPAGPPGPSASSPSDAPPASGGRGVVLPVVAIVVLVAGLALAVGGTVAVQTAQRDVSATRAALPGARADHEAARAGAAEASDRRAAATARRERAGAEVDRVHGLGGRAAAAAEDLAACEKVLVDSSDRELAALDGRDIDAANRAVAEYNAALGRCDAALDAYFDALAAMLGTSPGTLREA